MKWFEEHLHHASRLALRVDKVLFEGRTDYQHVEIFENGTFGRVLALDGIIQTTERDEYAYHEMLVHVPILAHGNVRKVLIVGGGDGGALEEVLKHPVEGVTMVEIDRRVVELCQEYLASICGDAFDDPRAAVVFRDAIRFVAETDQRFDVIIVDSTDPVGPGAELFQAPFYADCRRCLNDNGIVVAQNGVPYLQDTELRGTYQAFRELFPDAGCFLTAVPTYSGGFMALGWGGLNPNNRRVPRKTIERRFKATGIETRYYNPDIHIAAFALPHFIAEMTP